ncbi:MAG: DUF2877 domain-containing protein, partial [Chloroflexi bacterium]|nr:DUF2877 domain-containing protein [Chloroflexota bacterium]
SAPPPDPALSILLRLRESIRNRQWAQAAERAAPLIGLGRGLTPSGDDLILGLLLLLNRRGDFVEPFNRQMIEHARRRTTALSANLIECAARGEADERLLAAADCLLTGQPDAPTAARTLASWGASSGADTLAGMAMALSG